MQLLYLLKSKQAETVQQVAQLLGRNRVSVQKWLRRYRAGGLAEMPEKTAVWSFPDPTSMDRSHPVKVIVRA